MSASKAKTIPGGEPPADWWKFKITDEQALAWQFGDINAAKQFYNENEPLIKNIAHRYKYGLPKIWGSQIAVFNDARRNYELADMIHQIYVDLPGYDFHNGFDLVLCMRKSCVFVGVGGYEAALRSELDAISLDAPIFGKNGDDLGTLADIIADKHSIDDYVDRNPVMQEAFEKTLNKIARVLYPGSAKARKEFLRRA